MPLDLNCTKKTFYYCDDTQISSYIYNIICKIENYYYSNSPIKICQIDYVKMMNMYPFSGEYPFSENILGVPSQ